MKLPFFNRISELSRLKKAWAAPSSSFVCLYGRRRCGKSRLLQKGLEGFPHVYFIGDEREAVLQRRALAKEIGRLVPGFERVEYQAWDDLLERWHSDAPPGAILALDEFPFIASASPEFPAILQKYLDQDRAKPVHTAVCGSSQRMMHGLVLDSSAPLYGRAREILKITPLNIYYLHQAMGKKAGEAVIQAYGAWGGVPRYWELALEYATTAEAIRELVLSPLGVLYREPERLLTDQMRDTRQAASLLSLVGQGSHRLSEIAGRIQKPSTALARPLAMLADLGFITRETPFGAAPRDSKRTLYTIADPFLRFWFAFVEPNRSLLEAGLAKAAENTIMRSWPQFTGMAWEELARQSVPHLRIHHRSWRPAARWWGKAADAENLDLDLVSTSLENDTDALVGEVKLRCSPGETARLIKGLGEKASRCPALKGKNITCALWIMSGVPKGPQVVTADNVIASLK
jgi:AAA+ ATPase superfamily predicted ATPase